MRKTVILGQLMITSSDLGVAFGAFWDLYSCNAVSGRIVMAFWALAPIFIVKISSFLYLWLVIKDVEFSFNFC